MNFKKKKILITGASKGLGKEIAIEFEKLGSSLCLIARNEDLLKNILQKFKKKKEHLIVAKDLVEINNINEIFKIIKKKFSYFDIIIHCLGGSFGINDPLDSWSNFAKSLKGNLGTAVDINKNYIPKMIKKKTGNIIHVSSIVSQQSTASPYYCTAKSALNGYVRSMGNHLAKSGIFLSGIVPGAFIADENAMARYKYFKPKEYREFVKNLPQGEMPLGKEYIEIIKLLSCNKSARLFAGSLINLDSGQGLAIPSNI